MLGEREKFVTMNELAKKSIDYDTDTTMVESQSIPKE